MIFGKQSVHLLFTVLLICFVFSVRVLSGQTYINSAIEHAEIYSGTCLSIDPNCHVNEHKQVQLEEDPSSALNLSFHLMSIFASVEGGHIPLARLPHAMRAHAPRLLLQVFPTSIFHPPRR